MNSKIKILVDDKEIDYYTFADEVRNGDYFFKENGEWYLHKRPTIEEETEEYKKIEELFFMGESEHEKVIMLKDKLNEVINYINKEKEND